MATPDGGQPPILVMSGGGGRGRGGGVFGGGGRGSSRGGMRGAGRGAASRGRATFRNRSATFVNGSINGAFAAGANTHAGVNGTSAPDEDDEAGMATDDNGDQFGGPFAQASTSSTFSMPSSSSNVRPGGSALKATAPIFQPASQANAALVASRQRYPTPPLEENHFLEMKGERDELRKRYIREGILPDPLKPQQLSEAVKLRGTCMRMCSEFECHEREFQKELDRWELRLDAPPGSGAKVDHRLAVKIYRRPAAGREIALPEEIRPPEVLKRTLDYLFNVLLPPTITSPNFALVQPFLWNRTRAVRQDFIVQGETGPLAIECHERIARLHILCLHARGGPGAEKWSEQQELEQLRKTLRSLIEFYEDRRQAAGSTPGVDFVSPNEAEFRAYNLLLHLRDPETLREVELLPTSIFLSDQVQIALRLRTYAQRSNNIERRGQPINEEATLNFFKAFFKEVDRLPVGSGYLLACLAENVFTDIRRGAIKAMCRAYIERMPPSFEVVRRCLGLGAEWGDQDAVDLLATMGIEVFQDASGTRRAKAYRGVTVLEDKPLPEPPQFSIVIEAKRGDFTNAEIVDGIAGNATPLIEVAVPPFIGWNPHLTHQDQVTRPARPRPTVVPSAPLVNSTFKAEPHTAFSARASASQGAPNVQSSLPTAASAFQPAAQGSAFASAASTTTAFKSPFAVKPAEPPAVSAFSKPSTSTLPTVSAFGTSQIRNDASSSATTSAFTGSSFGQTSDAKSSLAAPTAAIPPTRPIFGAFQPLPAQTTPPQQVATTPPKALASAASTTPPSVGPSIFGVKRSPPQKPVVASPIISRSPARPRRSDEGPVVLPPIAAPPVPLGPTPQQLQALAKAAREKARADYLDQLQDRLCKQLVTDLLGDDDALAASSEESMTLKVAQRALANEFEARIVQTWAFDRWQLKLRRLRRDRANAKRLKDLLDMAAKRSLNASSFFIGTKKGSIAAAPGQRSFLSITHDAADQTMDHSHTLLDTSRRRAQLWASGGFLSIICSHIQHVQGSKAIRAHDIREWVAVVAPASQDPANATSEWIRQKLAIDTATRSSSVKVKRKDGDPIAVTAIESDAVDSDKRAHVGLVVFELSKHVLDFDQEGPRTRIDVRDLRRLNEVLVQLPISATRLLAGLLIVNWEVQASKTDLLEQLRSSIISDPRLSHAHPMLNRIAILMAGEIDDVDAIDVAFLAELRRAVPKIEAHPAQKILALRRALTLKEMASRIFKPLSNVLQDLAQTLSPIEAPTAPGSDLIKGRDAETTISSAFNTIVAICNYGTRALIRLSDHIEDEAELWTMLELPTSPEDALARQDAQSVGSAYRLANSLLRCAALGDQDGTQVVRCLLEQQQADGQAFPWRIYFSEVLSLLVDRAEETFISCRVDDIDVEAEMGKAATQIGAWGHQLLSEVHVAVSLQRSASLKRSRSMIEAASPASTDAENGTVKRIKTPSSGHGNGSSDGNGVSLSQSLRAILARARHLVE